MLGDILYLCLQACHGERSVNGLHDRNDVFHWFGCVNDTRFVVMVKEFERTLGR